MSRLVGSVRPRLVSGDLLPTALVAASAVEARSVIGRGMRAAGLDIATAGDGRTALRLALSGAADVILLDVRLPELSGYRVLEQLRAGGVNTPVLLLSANADEVDLAGGFDLGADAYLVWPFSFLVLVAQVRALLRRAGTEQCPSPRRSLVLGEIWVDPATRRVSLRGATVRLTPREFALLYALVSRPGIILSRHELLRVAWDARGATTANAIEVYIGYIRRKLRSIEGAHLLRTVRRQGYVFDLEDSKSTPAGLVVDEVQRSALHRDRGSA